jgi:6-pyruvoyltetrahydropterin/6-carboxytetrahydropterin synthase
VRYDRFGKDAENDSIYNLKPLTMIYLTRRERFNAAHRLYREDWSEEKNMEVFGKCSNPNWHGHNYVLFVTVKGELKPELGYVVDLKVLSRLIREYIIDKLDHKNLNLEVEFMKDRMMSTEQIAIAIWQELEPPVLSLGVELHCIRLEETENNFVEYFGK